MFAVIFEVEPHPDQWDTYLAHAAALRPALLRVDGFLDNRRFRSRRHPGRLLSLSYWRDEKALTRWRTDPGHHAVQAEGRARVFRDYRLRVGPVVRDGDAALTPARTDGTETGRSRKLTLLGQALAAPPDGITEWDVFDGITDPAEILTLLGWPDAATTMLAPAGPRRDVLVIRDYGRSDRREAPQYHDPVA